MDADSLLRHPGGPGDRQGPVSGARGRRRSSPRTVTQPATPLNSSMSSTNGSIRWSMSDARSPGCADHSRRPAEQTDNRIFDWATGDEAATAAVFDRAEIVLHEEIVYPRCTLLRSRRADVWLTSIACLVS